MKNNKSAFFKLISIIVIASVLLVVVANFNRIHYKTEGFNYVCIKDDLSLWTEGDFGLPEKVVADIIKNPERYYVVTFSGELWNNNFYSIYNWSVAEKQSLGSFHYWIDSSRVEGMFPFEPFSKAEWQTKVIVECSSAEVKSFSENIVMNELLICKGENKLQICM